LYRVAVESIDNALHHGKATSIKIKIVRDYDRVNLEIRNNGKPLPNDAETNRSKQGIYFQLEKLCETFGGETSIGPDPSGNGVLVSASLPCLPIHDIK
jgi:signal transduction histidine kinase